MLQVTITITVDVLEEAVLVDMENVITSSFPYMGDNLRISSEANAYTSISFETGTRLSHVELPPTEKSKEATK